jgi:hypothetical protein
MPNNGTFADCFPADEIKEEKNEGKLTKGY